MGQNAKVVAYLIGQHDEQYARDKRPLLCDSRLSAMNFASE